MQTETNCRDEHTIIGQILAKYPAITGLSREEQQVWDEWIAKDENKVQLDVIIETRESDFQRFVEIKANTPRAKVKFDAIINKAKSTSPLILHFAWLKMVAAALMIVLLASVSYYVWMYSRDKNAERVLVNKIDKTNSDKKPGKEGAILTLANGQQIILDTARNGLLTSIGKTEVHKKDGELVYAFTDIKSKTRSGAIVYNTLTTPRGRQFQLMLPDGTRLWLNAASTVKFPTQFENGERRIDLSGEAYLEVAKDSKRPFKLMADGALIEVIGTHFNVSCYKDEGVTKITLVEGKIKATKGTSTAVLSPSQQVQIKENKLKVVDKVNVAAVLGWKNGLIVFNNSDIKEAFRQISRWYAVDVEYKTSIHVPEVTGDIPRSVRLSQVLKVIEINTGLQSSILGNKIIVEQK